MENPTELICSICGKSVQVAYNVSKMIRDGRGDQSDLEFEWDKLACPECMEKRVLQ